MSPRLHSRVNPDPDPGGREIPVENERAEGTGEMFQRNREEMKVGVGKAIGERPFQLYGHMSIKQTAI